MKSVESIIAILKSLKIKKLRGLKTDPLGTAYLPSLWLELKTIKRSKL